MSCSLAEHKVKSWNKFTSLAKGKTITNNEKNGTITITPRKSSDKVNSRLSAIGTATRIKRDFDAWAEDNYGKKLTDNWVTINTTEQDSIILNYAMPSLVVKAIQIKNEREGLIEPTAQEEDAPYIVKPKRRMTDQEFWDRQRRTYGIDKNGDNVSYEDDVMFQSDAIQYQLKVADTISKNIAKIEQWESNKGISQEVLYNKIQQLGVPKLQMELLKESKGGTIGEKLSSLIANYSFVVEINTAKDKPKNEYGTSYYIKDGYFYQKNDEGYFKQLEGKDNPLMPISEKEYEQNAGSNTQHYSNLAVPGGTNYTENEISTPAITPNIKGHAQFATDQGIGWFRSDEKSETISKIDYNFETGEYTKNGKIITKEEYGKEFEANTIRVHQPTKTRRILEVQSDLFQKGRDKKNLINKDEESGNIRMNQELFHPERNVLLPMNESYFKKGDEVIYKNSELTVNSINQKYDDGGQKVWEYELLKYDENGDITDAALVLESELKFKDTLNNIEYSQNQFLQLLNKDNNWVTFFTKSIIQDSAKKGYEKVLFPSGNTAAKVEGHETLEGFKKEKEDRIKELEQAENRYDIWLEEIDDIGLPTGRKAPNKETADKRNFDKFQELYIDRNETEINQLKAEISQVEAEGFGALKPIYNFYENTVTNILNKQFGKDNVKVITDEYGNTWNEITLDSNRDFESILLQKIQDKDTVDPKVEAEMKRLIAELGIDLINYDEYAEYYKGKYGKDLTANAVADMFNNIIAVKEGRASKDTLPEEVGHFIEYALSKDPRIIEALANVHLTKEWELHSEQYMAEYGNDEAKVRREIVGKLIGNSLIDNIQDEKSSWKRLMLQIWNKFLDFFTFGTKAKEKRIRENIDSIARESLRSTKDIKKGLEERRAANTIKDEGVLFQLDPKKFENSKIFEGMKKELEGAIGIVHKKVKIFERKQFKDYAENEKALRKALFDAYKEIPESEKDKYSENRTTLGLINFIETVEKESKGIIKRAKHIKKSFQEGIYNNDLNEFNKMLREMNSYIAVYKPILDVLTSELILAGADAKASPNFKEEKKELLKAFKNINEGMIAMKDTYEKYSVESLAEIYRPFLERQAKRNNTTIDEEMQRVKELMRSTDKDITLAAYGTDSMAESGDQILGLTDRLTKEYIESKNFRMQELSTDVIDLDEARKAAGIENSQYMAELLDGKITGNFVTEVNMAKFKKVEESFYNELYKEFGLTVGEDFENISARQFEMSKWPDSRFAEYMNRIDRWNSINNELDPEYKQILADKKSRILKSILPFKKERSIIAEYQKKYTDYTEFKKNLSKDHPILFSNYKKAEEAYNKWRKDRYYVEAFTDKQVGKQELSRPKKSLYGNPQYDAIMANPAKKAYYEGIMAIRKELVRPMGDKLANSVLMPMMHKDFFEKFKNDPKTAMQKYFRDTFKRMEDETAFGKTLDEDGTLLQQIPIFFTKQLEDMNDLSLDVSASMIMFAEMALNYKYLNKIVDTIEMTSDILKQRNIETAVTGITVYDNLMGKQKHGTGGNTAKRIEQYIKMVFYHELKEDQGSTLGFDNAKVVDALIAYTAMNSLALNIYAGFNNVLLGNIMVREEAFAKQHISHENLRFATKTYWGELGELMGDIGKVRSNNKMRLVFEKLDVFQDHENRMQEFNTERSRWGKMMNRSTLFFVNKGGEHQIQGRMALGMMDNLKLKDSAGNEINLYDAFEVENYRIKIKEGTTNLDGTEFTESDLIAFTIKLKTVNQSLHGIYNVTDRSVMQRYWQGRAVILFRKWIRPGWNRRFKNKYYNYSLDDNVEGMYNTSWRFLRSLYEEVKEAQFSIARVGEKFNELPEWEKANLKRTITEVGYFLALVIAGGLLSSLADDDDDNWALNMVAYQTNRLSSELGFYFNPNDLLKLVQSPSATINQLDKLTDLIKIIDPSAIGSDDPFFREYKAGRNKGKTYGRIWAKKAIPMWKSVDDWFYPDEKLKFFSN